MGVGSLALSTGDCAVMFTTGGNRVGVDSGAGVPVGTHADASVAKNAAKT